MKKITMAIIVGVASLFASADVVTNGYFRYDYEVRDDGVLIKDVSIAKSLFGDVTMTIPGEINGVPVKYIREEAIAGRGDGNYADDLYEQYWLQVKKVVFPASFEKVESRWNAADDSLKEAFSYEFFTVYDDEWYAWNRSDGLTLEFKGNVPAQFMMQNWTDDEGLTCRATLAYPTGNPVLCTSWENAFKKECMPVFYTDYNGTIWRNMIVRATDWTPQTMKYFAALTDSLTEQGKSDANVKHAADALIALIKINENTTIRTMLSAIGIRIEEDEIKTESAGGNPGYQNLENYKPYQPNDLVEVTMGEYETFVSAINSLAKIDPSWKGSLVLSPDVIPALTEDVHCDYADVLIFKANLEALCAASQIANSYDWTLDWTKEFGLKINPTLITGDSDSEWEKVEKYAIEKFVSVQIAEMEGDLYFRITTVDIDLDYFHMDFFDGDAGFGSFDYWGEANLYYGDTYIDADSVALQDNVLTIKFEDSANSFVDVSEIWYSCAGYYTAQDNYWDCGYGVLDDKSIAKIVSEQPGMAGKRKNNAAGLADGKSMASNACETARLALKEIEARQDDSTTHFFNLATKVDFASVRDMIDDLQTAIEKPVLVEREAFTNHVCLAPFFSGTGPTYENLPKIVDGEFVEGSEIDSTYCGVLPQVLDLLINNKRLGAHDTTELSYISGSPITLTPNPLMAETFWGWYINGEKVTTPNYSFVPDKETTVEAIYLPSELVTEIKTDAKQEIVNQATAGTVDSAIADAVIANAVQKELALGNVAFEIEKDPETSKSVITFGLEVKESEDLKTWGVLTNLETKVEVELGTKGFYKFTVPTPSVE